MKPKPKRAKTAGRKKPADKHAPSAAGGGGRRDGKSGWHSLEGDDAQRGTRFAYYTRQSRQRNEVKIPPIKDRERRRHAEKDIYFGLSTYFSHVFTFPFTAAHHEIIDSLVKVMRYGGDKAIADSRGGGKSSIFRCAAILCLNFGWISYPVLFGAGLDQAEKNVKAIKDEYRDNDLLMEDFPEICAPIRELHGENRNANKQTVNGEPTHIWWAPGKLVFPTVRGSKASGSVMEFRSSKSGIRGLSHQSAARGVLRPDMCLIDDIETRESAASETQRDFCKAVIEGDMAGAAGMGKSLSRVMLCTLWSRESLAYRYTDPKSGWGGNRYKLLTKFPEAKEKWQMYLEMRQEDKSKGDDYGRRAFQFYQQHFEEMNAGAEVSNSHRHVTRLLEDGTPTQLTTLQFCYDYIADHADEMDPMKFFNEEYQNDPAEAVKINTLELTANAVANRLSGYARRVVPPDAVKLTQFIDVQKNRLYWVVVAWAQNMKGYVVDYGVTEIWPQDESRTAAELACLNALRTRWQSMIQSPCYRSTGEIVPVDLTLIDSAYELSQDAVYRFVRECGGVRVKPSRGLSEKGDSYTSPAPSPKVVPGDHWYQSLQQGGIWLVRIDTDYWRHRLHERWQIPMDKPGALVVFGQEFKENGEPNVDARGRPLDVRVHQAFSHHQVAKIWREKPHDPKRGIQGYWHEVSDRDDFEDCMFGNCVAASMHGIRVINRAPVVEPSVAPVRQPRQKRKSFAMEGGRAWK